MNSSQNSTERFSNRVENYVRYRPHYPQAVLECLQAGCGLSSSAVIADVGSGTGFLSELFLRHGNPVYGVEPNREMSEAGERFLREYASFHSVTGTAEDTTLPTDSVDFVSAGQAFHWFDRGRAKAEFGRILKPGGWVVLVWNERREGTDFGNDYDTFLQTYTTEYQEVTHKQVSARVLDDFFAGFEQCSCENTQMFDFEGLKGRFLSSSYAPEAGHPLHEAAIAELHRLFEKHQANGQVVFAYDTNCYYGHLEVESVKQEQG